MYIHWCPTTGAYAGEQLFDSSPKLNYTYTQLILNYTATEPGRRSYRNI